MASDPIQLHQVTLVHLLMENPCVVPRSEDRRQHRRAMNRQYQRACRARKKAQAARACSRDPADTVSTVSREREREKLPGQPPPDPSCPEAAQRPSASPPGNGKALNPTQKKLKERIAELQARVQRRGTT